MLIFRHNCRVVCILGGRLTVGHGTLNPSMKVRFLPSQPTRAALETRQNNAFLMK